jgi:flagellar hook-associated protein 1 FlgK
MRSTFAGLELAKRSLFTQQTALQTTGHNIANANTQGYTRQVVNMVASKPLEPVGLMRSTVPGQIGQGVEFDHIDRIREKFLDSQFTSENQSFGDVSIRKDTLDKLEAITNEPSDTGIREVTEAFWNSWQELSKTPENTTARVVVKQNALALTDAVNETSKKLTALSSDLTNNIEVNVKEANSMVSQISSLNNSIFRVEGLGDNANDLRDQRDLLVDKLSNILNITTTESSNGYTVKMGNVELVNGNTVTTTLTSASVAASMTSGDLTGGTLHGMFVSRDTDVADYKFQLDNMMKTLAIGDMNVTLPQGTVVPEGTTLNVNGVPTLYTGSIETRTLPADLKVTVQGLNGLHELGYSGMSGAVKSGVPFFTIKVGYTDFSADSITVNPDIVHDAANVSTSTRTYLDANGTEKVVTGNNDMALMISDLRNNKISFDPNSTGKPTLTDGTFDEFYRSIVSSLGVKSEDATRQAINQKILVDQVDSNRQSVSGVSLDEEMANMIKYQHSYNAAAKLMTMFDDMLDKLINGMIR